MSQPEYLIERYHDQPIPIHRMDQSWNATAMCQANGKDVADWWANKRTQRFVQAVSVETGIPVSTLVQLGKGHAPTIVHRRIATHVGQWCSTEFEVWVSGVLERLLIDGAVSLHRDPSGRMPDEIVAQTILGHLDQRFDQLELRVERIEDTTAQIEITVERTHKFQRYQFQQETSHYAVTSTRLDHIEDAVQAIPAIPAQTVHVLEARKIELKSAFDQKHGRVTSRGFTTRTLSEQARRENRLGTEEMDFDPFRGPLAA